MAGLEYARAAHPACKFVIAEEVKADTRKLYSWERFQTDVAEGPSSLKDFADRRRAFLLKTP